MSIFNSLSQYVCKIISQLTLAHVADTATLSPKRFRIHPFPAYEEVFLPMCVSSLGLVCSPCFYNTI